MEKPLPRELFEMIEEKNQELLKKGFSPWSNTNIWSFDLSHLSSN